MTTHIKHPLGGKAICGHYGIGIEYVDKDPSCKSCQKALYADTYGHKRIKLRRKGYDKRLKYGNS